MKLLTQKIKKQLPPLYATQDEKNPKIIAHFFSPMGKGDWYVIEGEEEDDGNYMFFGLVDLLCKEYGYFSLKELESIKLPLGMKIERDMYWTPKRVNELE